MWTTEPSLSEIENGYEAAGAAGRDVSTYATDWYSSGVRIGGNGRVEVSDWILRLCAGISGVPDTQAVTSRSKHPVVHECMPFGLLLVVIPLDRHAFGGAVCSSKHVR